MKALALVLLLGAAADPNGQAPPPSPGSDAAADADAIAARIRAATPDASPGAAQGIVAEDPRDPAYLIGKEIRCPVCQGMPIADSPAEMAQDMMKRVRAMHSEGKTREEIFSYFTKSYGDWVLLRPKATGANWLIWLLPPLALAFGIYGIRRYIRAVDATRPATQPGAEAAGDDEYLRLVRDEVER